MKPCFMCSFDPPAAPNPIITQDPKLNPKRKNWAKQLFESNFPATTRGASADGGAAAEGVRGDFHRTHLL